MSKTVITDKFRQPLIELLSDGGVAIFPCDTIYGIHGRVPETEEAIRCVKERDTKPFIQLIASPEDLLRHLQNPLPSSLFSLWPGAITLIVRKFDGEKVAYRVPSDPSLREVIRSVGSPLFSTSVNISGQEPLWRISDIQSQFGDTVPMIIDGGDIPFRHPSTIVDVTAEPYRLLRKGAVDVRTAAPDISFIDCT